MNIHRPVLVLVAILATAWSPLDAQLALGVRAGPTQSTLGISSEFDVVQGASAKYGAHTAVSLTYPFNDLLGLVAEVGYTQRGGGAHDPGLRCHLGARLR